MQLDTYELILYSVNAVIMPLLIVANLGGWSAREGAGRIMWGNYPNLMRISLVMIGLLTLWSWVGLAGHFGLISPATADLALPVIGVPFAVAAIAEIWLAASALRHYLAARRSAP